MNRTLALPKHTVVFCLFLLSYKNTLSLPQQNSHNDFIATDSLSHTRMLAASHDNAGQNSAEETQSVQWYTMITKLPRDWSALGSQLIDKHSLPVLAGLGAATIALTVFDYTTYPQTRNFLNSSGFLRQTRDDVILAGDGRYNLAAIGGLAVAGWATHNERLLRTTSEMAETFLASGIVVQILKHSTGRESPIVIPHDDDEWRPFPNLKQYQLHQVRYYSFPSGHLATLVGSLTVLNENYPEYRTWLRPVSYVLTGLLGISLVGKGMHWYSDLPVGIALGYSFGKIASGKYGADGNRSFNGEYPQITISPSFTLRGGCIDLNVAF
ncbi:MAG: phosphatase PAP2 family protein [Bacteroidota bacterium]|nr:phosphatase PAP2 family protein [Bacteroidota bacterium]